MMCPPLEEEEEAAVDAEALEQAALPKQVRIYSEWIYIYIGSGSP